MRTAIVVAAAVLVAVVSVPVKAASLGEALTIEAAVREALAAHPAIAAARSEAEALATLPDQEGTLPDPELMVGIKDLPLGSFSLTEEPMTQVEVGVSQMLPYPGKLARMAEAARYEAEAAATVVDETRLRLARDVRRAWWQLFFQERALEIVRRNQELLRQFVTIAQTKYKVGQGLQQEVLLAQLELSRLLEQEIRRQGERRAAQTRLNALLSRPASQPIQLPPAAEPALPQLLPEERLTDLAWEIRPQLAAQRARIDAARERVELAKLERRPDFGLTAMYGLRAGLDDMVSVQLSVSLPIRAETRQNRAVDQRASEALREGFMLQDLQLELQMQIGEAVAEYRRLVQQAALLKGGIIPQARQTVDSMLAGYQVNKVDFLNLVQAQVTLAEQEMQYWEALGEARQTLAELAMLVGEETVHE